LNEALGKTTDENKWVYLSDGGHFENLGLYETVLRRCKKIIIADAGADPAFTLEDLGNAVRKIQIDFGIPITFDPPAAFQPGPNPQNHHYFIGKIRYSHMDLEPAERDRLCQLESPAFINDWQKQKLKELNDLQVREAGQEKEYQQLKGLAERSSTEETEYRNLTSKDGVLVYLKASLNGNEPADVTQYAKIHKDFPHESTANQFFNESQFESYVRLGVHVVDEIMWPKVPRIPTMASPTAIQAITLQEFFDAAK
jgi:hypothetical protein